MKIESSIELFEHVRSEYVGRWLLRLGEVERTGTLVGIEAPMLAEGGGLATVERGGFPFRADLVARDASGVPRGVSCVFPQVVTFAPVRFNHDGSLPLLVSPFFWTAAPLRVLGGDAGELRHRIAAWASRWFGFGGELVEAIPEQRLHGVIHRVQYLELECADECTVLEVDLGSAHVEALMTLLDVMKRCGAREVRLGDPELAAD